MRKYQRLYFIVLVLFVLGFIASSCAERSIVPQPITEMTNKDKARFAMSIYNRMYADYQRQVALPNLSDAEKQMLKYKYQVITEAWPKIKAFDDAVVAGKPVDGILISFIDSFINTYRY